MFVDVGKISVIGLSVSVESFIILHACRTPIWHFLLFYDFYTRESAAGCDCQRLFYHSGYSLLKEIKFFFLRVFLGQQSIQALCPRTIARPLEKLPLSIFASRAIEMGVYESTTWSCNMISLVQQKKWITPRVYLTTPLLQ